MIKIYIAGPLFNEADIGQRKKEEQLLVETCNEAVTTGKYHIFNPITSPINFKDMNPTASDIFREDMKWINETTHFFFDLSNTDTGTFVELGMALEMFRINREAEAVGYEYPRYIYPVISDIRVPEAGNYEGFNVPVGNNQFVIGALEFYGIEIYHSFEEARKQFELDVRQVK